MLRQVIWIARVHPSQIHLIKNMTGVHLKMYIFHWYSLLRMDGNDQWIDRTAGGEDTKLGTSLKNLFSKLCVVRSLLGPRRTHLNSYWVTITLGIYGRQVLGNAKIVFEEHSYLSICIKLLFSIFFALSFVLIWWRNKFGDRFPFFSFSHFTEVMSRLTWNTAFEYRATQLSVAHIDKIQWDSHLCDQRSRANWFVGWYLFQPVISTFFSLPFISILFSRHTCKYSPTAHPLHQCFLLIFFSPSNYNLYLTEC